MPAAQQEESQRNQPETPAENEAALLSERETDAFQKEINLNYDFTLIEAWMRNQGYHRAWNTYASSRSILAGDTDAHSKKQEKAIFQHIEKVIESEEIVLENLLEKVESKDRILRGAKGAAGTTYLEEYLNFICASLRVRAREYEKRQDCPEEEKEEVTEKKSAADSASARPSQPLPKDLLKKSKDAPQGGKPSPMPYQPQCDLEGLYYFLLKSLVQLLRTENVCLMPNVSFWKVEKIHRGHSKTPTLPEFLMQVENICNFGLPLKRRFGFSTYKHKILYARDDKLLAYREDFCQEDRMRDSRDGFLPPSLPKLRALHTFCLMECLRQGTQDWLSIRPDFQLPADQTALSPLVAALTQEPDLESFFSRRMMQESVSYLLSGSLPTHLLLLDASLRQGTTAGQKELKKGEKKLLKKIKDTIEANQAWSEQYTPHPPQKPDVPAADLRDENSAASPSSSLPYRGAVYIYKFFENEAQRTKREPAKRVKYVSEIGSTAPRPTADKPATPAKIAKSLYAYVQSCCEQYWKLIYSDPKLKTKEIKKAHKSQLARLRYFLLASSNKKESSHAILKRLRAYTEEVWPAAVRPKEKLACMRKCAFLSVGEKALLHALVQSKLLAQSRTPADDTAISTTLRHALTAERLYGGNTSAKRLISCTIGQLSRLAYPISRLQAPINPATLQNNPYPLKLFTTLRRRITYCELTKDDIDAFVAHRKKCCGDDGGAASTTIDCLGELLTGLRKHHDPQKWGHGYEVKGIYVRKKKKQGKLAEDQPWTASKDQTELLELLHFHLESVFFCPAISPACKLRYIRWRHTTTPALFPGLSEALIDFDMSFSTEKEALARENAANPEIASPSLWDVSQAEAKQRKMGSQMLDFLRLILEPTEKAYLAWEKRACEQLQGRRRRDAEPGYYSFVRPEVLQQTTTFLEEYREVVYRQAGLWPQVQTYHLLCAPAPPVSNFRFFRDQKRERIAIEHTILPAPSLDSSGGEPGEWGLSDAPPLSEETSDTDLPAESSSPPRSGNASYSPSPGPPRRRHRQQTPSITMPPPGSDNALPAPHKLYSSLETIAKTSGGIGMLLLICYAAYKKVVASAGSRKAPPRKDSRRKKQAPRHHAQAPARQAD